jgi:hypothetical protein
MCYISCYFQGLREILERYMEDDQDMYRMCLSKWRDAELENADAGSDNTLLIGGCDYDSQQFRCSGFPSGFNQALASS